MSTSCDDHSLLHYSVVVVLLTVCCYRYLSDCVCVGTADGKLTCFKLIEG